MISFQQFITEQQAASTGPIKHLMHAEEPSLDSHEGVEQASRHLMSLSKMLSGRAPRGFSASWKKDGAPSFVVGVDRDGRHYVGTKSIANKTPKINYTEEDIDANHGHAPGLAQKLKDLLRHVHKVLPKDTRPGEQFQGDMMFGEGDQQTSNGHVQFQPNTIRYHLPQGSAEGQQAQRAKIGVVFHTHIRSGVAGPIDEKTRNRFRNHPDVYNLDPTMSVNPNNFTADDQKEFHEHMENARAAYAKVKPEAYDALQGHGIGLRAHINEMIKTGGEPSVEGYRDYLQRKHERELEKLKSAPGRARKIAQHNETLSHLNLNKGHFKSVLDTHQHLQKAKNVLVRVMEKNSPFMHTINGNPTGPEGSVTVHKHSKQDHSPDEVEMLKMVNRGEFSAANFANSKFQKQEQPIKESVDSIKWKAPNHSAEHDEVHYQLAGHEEHPFLPDWAHKRLQQLSDRSEWNKAIGQGKVETMNRNKIRNTGNTSDASEVTPMKKRRVSSLFASGKEVERPIVLKHPKTGETHLIAGNSRSSMASRLGIPVEAHVIT